MVKRRVEKRESYVGSVEKKGEFRIRKEKRNDPTDETRLKQCPESMNRGS